MAYTGGPSKPVVCGGGSQGTLYYGPGRIQGEGAGGAHLPPPRDDLQFSNTTGILPKKKNMWFFGVEVEQETSAPPPKKQSWIRPCGLYGKAQ